MASMLSARVKPGGDDRAVGILARQADEVAAVYARWIDIGVWRNTRLGVSCRYPRESL